MIIEIEASTVVQTMTRVVVFLKTKDMRIKAMIATVGIINPEMACNKPKNFEPSAETVGTSDIKVSSTLPTTMMDMIEIGKTRFP
jgi:hypothetical protein